MELNNGNGKYSKTEKLLFSYVPRSGKTITSTEILERRRKDEKDWNVDNPRNVISLVMRSLIVKIARNRESFRLRKSERFGPYPTEYWIEKRNGK